VPDISGAVSELLAACLAKAALVQSFAALERKQKTKKQPQYYERMALLTRGGDV
jgi:hypothetical protein